jgi:RND family efflux transporter MFP subunit
MSHSQAERSGEERALSWKATLLICCVILLAGAGLVALIFSTEPTAVRTGASKETAMLVTVAKGQRGAFRPVIRAMGTVIPSREVILRPRVEGEIVERSPSFTPGGFAAKGETLVRLDPADFENALKQRRSDLAQAISELHIERGRQHVAREDYLALEETLPKEQEDLVLRQPQLSSVKARVASARAAVQQAELELQRTNIKAPFDAHILSRNANLGSQVSIGDNLGRLVGLDTYWVEATVPLAKLRRLSFPNGPGAKGSKVRVRNVSAWPEGAFREGRLFRSIGSLEEQTRMARVLVSVEDPLARHEASRGKPALMLGSFVQVAIQADPIEDVVRLDRDLVRSKDTAWVMQDGELDIRELDIVFRDAEYAYIRSGLQENEPVVSTNLATVVEGARLRLKPSNATARESSGQNNGHWRQAINGGSGDGAR